MIASNCLGKGADWNRGGESGWESASGRWLNAQIHGILQGAAGDPRPKFIFVHCNFVAIFELIFILFFALPRLGLRVRVKGPFASLFRHCNFFSFFFSIFIFSFFFFDPLGGGN